MNHGDEGSSSTSYKKEGGWDFENNLQYFLYTIHSHINVNYPLASCTLNVTTELTLSFRVVHICTINIY